MTGVRARPPLSADGATSALIGGFERLTSVMGPPAMIQMAGDAVLMVTGVQVPLLNWVCTVRASASTRDVAGLLDEVAHLGLPHTLDIRPGCPAALADLARKRGMLQIESTPLMAMEPDLESLRSAAFHPDLSIRTLGPHELGLHASIAAEGFDAPIELFERMMPAAALAIPGLRVYVGFVDGEPVTTAVGLSEGDYVGIFNVATPGTRRGRGYGAAVTARAVVDGLEEGASFAYLQSSVMGFKIYERLGFRTIENWSIWIAGGPETR